MRKSLLLSSVLFAAGILCLGQQPRAWWQSVQQISVGASYQGPGDVVSGATSMWGVSAYNAAFSGNILKICDSATGVVCANATWTAAGGLSLPLIGGLVCNNTTNVCDIDTFFDTASGGINMVQTTNTKRANLIIPAASNGCPTDGAYCADFVGANSQCYVASSTVTQAQPLSYAATFKGGGTGANQTLLNSAAGNRFFGPSSAANAVRVNFGANTSTAGFTDNTWHALQVVANGASGVVASDGASTTINTGTNAYTADTLSFGGGTSCAATFLTGRVGYMAYYPIGFSAGNITALNTNAHAYPSTW